MPEGLEVSTAETARALEEDAAQVVDVREPYERDAGYVAGTRHIAMNALAAEAGTLDPDRPVIFVCRSGARSLMAAQALSQAGLDAYSMAGGLVQWAGEGRPLTPEGGRVADH